MTASQAHNVIKQLELTPSQLEELSQLLNGGAVRKKRKEKVLLLVDAKADFKKRLFRLVSCKEVRI